MGTGFLYGKIEVKIVRNIPDKAFGMHKSSDRIGVQSYAFYTFVVPQNTPAMKKLLCLGIILPWMLSNAMAQPLPRKGWMNLQTLELNDSLRKATGATTGLYVSSVGEPGTGFNLGVRAGDVLLTLEDMKTESKEALRNAMLPLREGDTVSCSVLRKNKSRILKGVVAPNQREASGDYEVLYDRVAMGDGFLSLIITKPKGEGKFPVVLFIPGYMCYSLDNIGTHPYGRIADLLTRAGYAVVRVEKSGEGASVNTPDCRSIGFREEVDGFRAGLLKAYTLPFADTSNMFIFGHSLGAMQAPLVAAGTSVKGIIIEGTSGDTWFEYILAMFRFQNPIMGSDPAENEAMIARSMPMLYRYLVMKQNPAELAKTPIYDTILTEMMQYDGNEHIWDRHYIYWQELQDMNQAEAWRDCSAKVLVMRGSGDLEAFSTEQHESIVRTINHYRPGAASFVLLSNSDHAFCKSNTPEESFKNAQTKGYHRKQFNDEVIFVVSQWMESVMKQ